MPQCRFPLRILAAVGAMLMLSSGVALAQGAGQMGVAAVPQAPGKFCECRFSSGQYEAYSTDGTCTVQRYGGGRKCEFGFAGVGANPGVLSSLLGQDAYSAQFRLAPEILARYLAFAQTGDTTSLSDSKFIEAALPVLARASLFREAVVRAELPIKQMDAEIVEFSRKYSEVISAVFRGKQAPQTIKWSPNSQFEIGQGFVQLDFQQQSQLLVLFFANAKR
jgi:hypothetical protein